MGLDAIVQERVNGELRPVVKKRLGNASMVGWIAKEILSLSPEGSILIEKVVYNGSHSGDAIGVEHLDALQDEVDRISLLADEGKNDDLNAFLRDMRELIHAAKEHHTPIVFV